MFSDTTWNHRTWNVLKNNDRRNFRMLRTSYVQSDASEHRRLAPNAPMLLRKPGYLLQFTFSLRSVPFGCMNQPATRLFSTPAMIEAESETRQYWLVKGEPDVAMKGGLDLGSWPYSRIETDGSAAYDGVRNHQARNFLQQMKLGDGVLYYHSSCKKPGVYGICEVARAAYPDPTASDAEHPLYDAKQHVETAKAKSKAKATAKVEVTSGVEAKDKAAGGNAASAAGIVARWWAIDLEAVRELPSPVLLPALKARPELGEMALLKQPRLSVQPVAAAEWATILSMAEEVGSGNRDALNGAVNKAKEGLNEDKGRSTKKRTRSGVRKEN